MRTNQSKNTAKFKIPLFIFLIQLGTSLSFAQTTKTLDLGEFSTISLNSDYKVSVRQSNIQEVKVKADNDILSATNIWVDNGVLHIDLKSTESNKKTILKKIENKLTATMELEISVKTLRKIIVNGNGSVTSGNSISAVMFDIEMNGDGRVNVDVKSSRVNASLYASGEIQVTGYADALTLLASGNGTFNGANFDVKKANVEARGMDTKCTLSVSETMNVEVFGGAEVLYSGGTKDIVKHIYGDGFVLFRK